MTRRAHDSKLEERFAAEIVRRRLPEPVFQHRFAADAMGRQWRFDVAWPHYLLAVEIDGYLVERGNVSGGHGKIVAIRNALTKRNAAILLGWHVLVFEQSLMPTAIDVTMRALVSKGWTPGTAP